MLKDNVEGLKTDVTELKDDVMETHLVLENVTNKNIRIVAENHLSLNHKLNEALKVDEEKEMLLIRMNCVESDVRQMKRLIKKAGIA